MVLGIDIILQEMYPFRFSAMPQPFHWIPFAPVLEAGSPPVSIFLNKLFLYAATVWLVGRAWGRTLAAACVLAAVLLGLEQLQCFLPGRTPESTDAVMMLGSGIAFVLVNKLANKHAHVPV